MPAADWMPIPPRYGRLLGRLKDQRKVDPYGGIGWLGLREEPEVCKSTEQLFDPLLGRAMVESCEAASGKHFVRATDFGLVCLALGYMPRGRVTALEAQRWADEIPKLTPGRPEEVRGEADHESAQMTPLQKRADSMISKMRARCAEKVAESGRILRHGRRLPFGVPMLRDWLVSESVGQTGEVWRCRYCERQLSILGVEADHVVSLSRGGSPGLENLCIACKLCNQTKGEMSLEAFNALRKGLESFPAADRAYILKCLRTHGIGQRLRFPPKPKPTPAGEPGDSHAR